MASNRCQRGCRGGGPLRGGRRRILAVVMAALVVSASVTAVVEVAPGYGSVAPASAVTASTLPSFSAITRAAKTAADYYRLTYAHTTLTPKNGWSWATYFDGVQALYRLTGDAKYQSDGMSWGASNSWGLTINDVNPDTIKAGQDYFALNAVDSTASLSAMDARMADDLVNLAPSQYDWIDALYMGLPDWALWATRTGNSAYLAKLDAFFLWTRDQGGTSTRCSAHPPTQPGLFDAGQSLWYRDCSYVNATDVNGKPVFWSRGNGWVIAAMAEVLNALPAGDPHAAKYASMLQAMAARLATLQGSDGFWRSSLVDAALYPQPETSGTALITFALASGVKSGVLDAATYLPVIAKAWQGLTTTALRPSGFLSDCQPQGAGPAAPYTALAPRTAPTSTSSGTVNDDSPPFCVGAFLLAGTAVAQLIHSPSTGRPVTFTSQQVGNEASRVDDANVTTRWSANGFPQAVTVDLGTNQSLGSSMVVPYLDRAYRYRIETSTDALTWHLAVDRSSNVTKGSDPEDFAPVSARYVRLTVLGVSNDPTTWVSIQEFAVYPPPSAAAALAADTFTRTVANGLGVADTGGAWTVAGPTTAYSVSNGAAHLAVTAPGTARAAYLPALSAADVDVVVAVSVDKPVTGGGTYLAVAARHAATSEYRAKVKIVTSGAVTLSLVRVVNGAETTLASQAITGVLATPNTTLRIRLDVVGAGTRTLKAKVWQSTKAEPASWQLSATDATSQLQVAGGVGFYAYASSTSTNTPITASFDNLVAVASG